MSMDSPTMTKTSENNILFLIKACQCTYLGRIDLRGYGYSDKEMASLLVEKANVLLEGASVFGPEGTGFQHINVVCSQALLERGLTRIARVLTWISVKLNFMKKFIPHAFPALFGRLCRTPSQLSIPTRQKMFAIEHLTVRGHYGSMA